MKPVLFLGLMLGAGPVLPQAGPAETYRLALPDHSGELQWSIGGFQIIENSAKSNGREIGVRGRDASGRLTFLGFLFLATENSPVTAAACRDGVLAQEKKANATLKIVKTSELAQPSGSHVSLVSYTSVNADGSLAYRVRGFIGAEDLCADLEFYSHDPIHESDADLKEAFSSFHLNPGYPPQFGDLALYAQILLRQNDYSAAAPIFEKALKLVPSDGAPFSSAQLARRVVRDQAGMSYGISGDLAKARRIFEEGTVVDPDYPMNYYNLACADAGEKRLMEARVHLRQAFDRKGDMNPGESLPDPTQDGSFLPFKDNQEFWTFLKELEAHR